MSDDATQNKGIPTEVGAQPSTRMRSADLRVFEEDVARRFERNEGQLKALEEAMIEHRVRLENGTHVFTDIKSEIATVRTDLHDLVEKSAPKPVDWWRIVVPISGLLITLLTAWWALSTQLSARPTAAEVEKALSTHTNATGHPSMANEVRQVREDQIKQNESLKGLTDKVDQTRKDVGEIKEEIRSMRGSRPSVPQQP